jgi:hypothetical protein
MAKDILKVVPDINRGQPQLQHLQAHESQRTQNWYHFGCHVYCPRQFPTSRKEDQQMVSKTKNRSIFGSVTTTSKDSCIGSITRHRTNLSSIPYQRLFKRYEKHSVNIHLIGKPNATSVIRNNNLSQARFQREKNTARRHKDPLLQHKSQAVKESKHTVVNTTTQS